MSELMERFLRAADRGGMLDLAKELTSRRDPTDVPALIACLADHLEARREVAAWALAFWPNDSRAIRPLIQVLDNPSETPAVRGQAAEAVRCHRARKALPSLVRGSRDASPEVRFWCVFALGAFLSRRDRPREVVQALADRLTDVESPDGQWPIRLEALAMLSPLSPYSEAFVHELERVREDPAAAESEKNWAYFYWMPSTLASKDGGAAARSQRSGKPSNAVSVRPPLLHRPLDRVR